MKNVLELLKRAIYDNDTLTQAISNEAVQNLTNRGIEVPPFGSDELAEFDEFWSEQNEVYKKYMNELLNELP